MNESCTNRFLHEAEVTIVHRNLLFRLSSTAHHRKRQFCWILIPALAKEGFVLEEFGRDSFLVRAIPVVLGKLEDTTMIDEIISDLVSEEPSRTVNNRERITRIIACRGAIKAGTICTKEQCQRIIYQIRNTRNPFTCPHGRPTMLRFSRADLDAMFKRT